MIIVIKDEAYIKAKFDFYYKGEYLTIQNNKIYLDNYYYFDDGSSIKNLEYRKYKVKSNNDTHLKEIFIYQDDNNFNEYKICKKEDFIFARNIKATIISSDPYIKNEYLVFRNNSLETNSPYLLLNHHPYNNESLKNGDFVELYSFSFYYFDNYLYITKYLNSSKQEEIKLQEKLVKYDVLKPKLNNYYENKKYELVIDNLDNFDEPKKNNHRKLIFQMGPTLTMSLAMMLIAGINIYNTYLNNGSILQMAVLIVMPITMLLSGVFWPLISSFSEKKQYEKQFMEAKKNYLDYLREYESCLIEKINEYKKDRNEYFFNSYDILNKLFYITKKSHEFLNISLGLHTEVKSIEYRKTKDKDIDESLSRIKYRLNNIEETPLFLDLKNNKRVTIISNNKSYFFNKILLELAYKYNYEDLYIAIYSKNKETFKYLNNIPHLFFNNKRLTFLSEREIQDLNNYKLDKPLVLLMNDYSDFVYTNKNIHMIYFSYDENNILKDSSSVIEFKEKGVLNSNGVTVFKYENQDIDFDYYLNIISKFNKNNKLYKINSFKDIFHDININKNYLTKPCSLEANFASIGDEVLAFDLHESKDGPHGLIGGSTGSGKSELIVSLLLSLVLKYSPEYLNIILIDYKGGGIKESLSYNLKTVPHIIAAINNLEEDTFERLTVAINRELKKRQLLFKNLSNISSSSIMNIDDYLNICDEYHFLKIPHLLIVVDEFAELKKENPEVIKELISFSRIGRSLGLHLILATQKPGGVIDEEIWSNSHFKIALKVHSEKDSQDIIKTKEASSLVNPGDFYLQVDDNTIKAKAIYSKKDINGNDSYEVALLTNTLEVKEKKILRKDNIITEASYIVSKIIKTTNDLKLKTINFEFDKPIASSISNLEKKYDISNAFVIGEVDDYLNAKKDILAYPIDSNILIYSNRNNEINNILNTLNNNLRRSIVISKNRYSGLYISDSLTYEDEDDILYLLKKLLNDNKVECTIVIEDLNSFLSYNEDYLGYLYDLLRRSEVTKYNLVILSKISNINFKILNNIKNKVGINIYEVQDLINLFSSKGEYKGKSYFYKGTPVTFIPALIEDYKASNSVVSEYVDYIKDTVLYENTNDSILIGYDLLTRQKINIKQNEKILITGFDTRKLSVFSNMYKDDKNIIVNLYQKSLLSLNINSIVWIGEGIENQRLFYIDKYDDLSLNEAYYYKNGRVRKIRVVKYE